jgi:hypothetical protein
MDYRREAKKIQLSPLGKEKLDYPREAKKELIIAVRRESPSGGMKLILAVRQRKVDYRREAKKKIDITARRREWNQLMPWGAAGRPNKMSMWGATLIPVRHGHKAKENIAMEGARL